MKGTSSKGKKSGKKNMVHCRRCSKRTFHMRKKKCASCGFGKSKRLRDYRWKKK
jgi:large subunit ribosomal protein L37e